MESCRVRSSCFVLLACFMVLPGVLSAQQFQHVDPLFFTKAFAGPDPLPQVLAISSTAANFNFAVTATSTGGWLSALPSGNCCTTPRGVSVVVNTPVAMAAGTYTGQVAFTAGGVTTLTVPVTLVIAAVNTTFFDNMPGQVSFSMTPGSQPPSQVLQVRNAGTGTLDWTLSTSTSNAGSWLTVSTASGSGIAFVTVSIVTANLPSGGALAGTYSGQLLFTSSGGNKITVPVGLTIATNAMSQVNALSFDKPFGGKDPLPQTVTIASLGAAFNFSVAAYSGTGSANGNWLSSSPSGNCCTAPRSLTISSHPEVSLAAGSYMGEVVVDNGNQIMVIPVTLIIGAPNSTFFDNQAGQVSFSMDTAPLAPPASQFLQIRGAGSGTLNWTLTATTHDSGSWLTLSATSGTAPSQISIGVLPQNLPTSALTSGVYTANLLFTSGTVTSTVPVTVRVGTGIQQISALNFAMPQFGANPLPQNITVASSGAAQNFSVAFYTATGGSWLAVSPSGNCCTTPRALQVSITAPSAMPAGTYTAEIVITGTGPSLTVPVTLTVAPPTVAFFDNLPGELSFSMQTGSPLTPSSQVFQIRNGGTGTLNWTLAATTYDGGNWLTVSAPNGTAPSLVTVGVVPGNLPNGGLLAGVFTGQLLLQSGLSSLTIPVSMTVGAAVMTQVNGLSFTMPQTGRNPLPQVFTETSTGAQIGFSLAYDTGTGGNWLTVAPSGNCCVTPEPVVVTVNAPPGMAAGTYTAQISLYSGTVSQSVPVTLTVAPPTVPFFDNLPGAVSFSMANNGTAPPSQSVQVRNSGTGNLAWTLKVSTFDGGNWLTASSVSGTAPSVVTLGIVPQNLPNAGLVAGLVTGHLLFISDSSSVTVPVSLVVGGNGFSQTNGLHFTMPLAGSNPLPQYVTATSIGSAVGFSVAVANGNGGTWMSALPLGNCCVTPEVLAVTVNAPVGLAAGTYTSELYLIAGGSAMVLPVTLTVEPSTVPFFDNAQGHMSFFAATAATPASQTVQIRNYGAGALNWTLTPSTADSLNWLTVSSTSGTAPSTITVGVNPQNLPNQGLIAGQFVGQLLFQSSTGNLTVPVSVQLGPNIFSQLTNASFSMAYSGANPLPQAVSVTGSGSSVGFAASYFSGNGGNWLSGTPSGNCCGTPQNITLNVNGAPGGTPVPAGLHTGQAVFNHTSSVLVLPVNLSVAGTPLWRITKTHTGDFTPNQTNATYTVTVSNQTGNSVGNTNGTATLTEAVPVGMTLVSMAGDGWTCGNGTNTCTRGDSLSAGGSYPPVTVTVNVASSAAGILTNSVSISGGGSVTATATDNTKVITKCDADQDGAETIADIQAFVSAVLGIPSGVQDLNNNGIIDILDIQIVVNAALGQACPVN